MGAFQAIGVVGSLFSTLFYRFLPESFSLDLRGLSASTNKDYAARQCLLERVIYTSQCGLTW
jgi:hypothetical protein